MKIRKTTFLVWVICCLTVSVSLMAQGSKMSNKLKVQNRTAQSSVNTVELVNNQLVITPNHHKYTFNTSSSSNEAAVIISFFDKKGIPVGKVLFFDNGSEQLKVSTNAEKDDKRLELRYPLSRFDAIKDLLERRKSAQLVYDFGQHEAFLNILSSSSSGRKSTFNNSLKGMR